MTNATTASVKTTKGEYTISVQETMTDRGSMFDWTLSYARGPIASGRCWPMSKAFASAMDNVEHHETMSDRIGAVL